MFKIPGTLFFPENKLRQARHLSAMGGWRGEGVGVWGGWGGGKNHKTYLICDFLNIHTLIFHVAIWPVLPYVTRYIFTYIGLYKCVLFVDVFETSQNGVCLVWILLPHLAGVLPTVRYFIPPQQKKTILSPS